MILEKIVADTVCRVAAAKQALPAAEAARRALALPVPAGFPFRAALARPGLRFICEVKKASPSKGVIDPVFDYKAIARAYRDAGADAVSVLTEPHFFLGGPQVLADIAAEISTPLLRKDFVVDDYQLYEARLLGASAVLLISEITEEATLGRRIALARRLGLSALVEAHTEPEIAKALRAGADLLGVNNRDLRTFAVDFSAAARLRALVPPGVLFVAESGVASPADAAVLRQAGADAALVGEYLMRAPDKTAALAALRAAAAPAAPAAGGAP